MRFDSPRTPPQDDEPGEDAGGRKDRDLRRKAIHTRIVRDTASADLRSVRLLGAAVLRVQGDVPQVRLGLEINLGRGGGIARGFQVSPSWTSPASPKLFEPSPPPVWMRTPASAGMHTSSEPAFT